MTKTKTNSKTNYKEPHINHILLKEMEEAGLIKLHKDTAKFGYINEGPLEFEFQNNVYNTKFFSGCFCPYVVWNKDKTIKLNSKNNK